MGWVATTKIDTCGGLYVMVEVSLSAAMEKFNLIAHSVGRVVVVVVTALFAGSVTYFFNFSVYEMKQQIFVSPFPLTICLVPHLSSCPTFFQFFVCCRSIYLNEWIADLKLSN